MNSAGPSRTGAGRTGDNPDEAFLGGPASLERRRTALDRLNPLWVGVRCTPEVAAGRETARGARSPRIAIR
ncbi:phosphotransferase-like protein [Streptomyces flaveolus]|uniref:phosphotransferase-like protein n=1 Tax=Streptomyces flaveolus TaxID=67297 RepID=UPI003F55168A